MMDDFVVLPNFFRPGAADLQLTSLNLKKNFRKNPRNVLRKKVNSSFFEYFKLLFNYFTTVINNEKQIVYGIIDLKKRNFVIRM